MKFSTVRIRPNVNQDGWEYHFEDHEGDRKNEKTDPNSLGFYHYPQRIGKKKAFEKLRAHLVAKHEETIAALTKSLNSLKKLRMLEEDK